MRNSNQLLQAKSYKLKAAQGQLLLEVLFTITVAGAILGAGTSLLIAGLQSAKVSVERNTAIRLVDETLEAVRSVAFGKWDDVYGLDDKGDSNLYHPILEVDPNEPYILNSHSGGWGTGDVTAVSAYAPGSVWIGIATGGVYQYDGEAWQDRTLTTAFTRVNDIATVSDTEVWAVGNGGLVYQWNGNGSTWTQHVGTSRWEANNIYGVSASDSSNVWVVGASGHVWKYDGSEWTQHSGSGRWGTAQINSVSALSDNAYIGGANGNVWQYDGSGWTNRSGGGWGSSITMNAVSFASSSNVWVGGTSGHVWQYNGSTWTRRFGTGYWGSISVSSLSAYDTDHIFLSAGDGLWSYVGGEWLAFSNSEWTPEVIFDISDRYSTELWVVGDGGTVTGLKPGRWTLAPFTEDDIVLNGTTYTRSFYVENVNRTGGNIVSSGGTEDKSTQRITATVSWSGNSISSSEYISRWTNDSCLQTQWSTNNQTLVHTKCPTANYHTQTNIDFLLSNTSISILLPLVNSTGTLTSTVFDTNKLPAVADDSPIYRFINWSGIMSHNSDKVEFKIATSDSASGPWADSDFYGDLNGDGTCSSAAGDWFSWTGPTTFTSGSKQINCSQFDDERYFKYRVRLTRGAIGTTPRVDDVSITWSP